MGNLINEQMEAISREILVMSRNELYLSMRFLDLALSGLEFQATTETDTLGTDGMLLFANPAFLTNAYRRDRKTVNRLYLHTVYHCLFRHLFKATDREPGLWQIACDTAVEYLIDGLNYRCIRQGRSRIRRTCYQELEKRMKVITAEGIYHVLTTEGVRAWQRKKLEEEFCVDDHSAWPAPQPPGKPPAPQAAMVRQKWEDISSKTQTEMETFAREQSSGAEEFKRTLAVENRERYDYRAFLRKFAVLREEVQVDADSFDYVFYSLGLRMYGNMPLIEPQEVKEVKKIREFVIVIDTSMSTSGELVEAFLSQTYEVLRESESFFQKVHIRIIQCDETVKRDVKITCGKELEEYMAHFTLEGNGGTDFRPAFAYVDELIERHELTELKGLIYFTDGRGIYPVKRPVYDTAFVFLEEDYTDVQVPPWAIKLILEREELEEQKKFRTDYRFVDQKE